MNPIKYFSCLIVFLLLTSCGSKNQLVQSSPGTEKTPDFEEVSLPSDSSEDFEDTEYSTEPLAFEEDLISKITAYAREFLGTGYKYGGTGPEGMDCSGLVHTAFSTEDIQLPRTSREMARLGEKLDLEQVINGDLLFFRTNPRKAVINHVGLVVDMLEDGIYFIHSTTSRGVIISSLSERYWKDNFVTARRIQ